MLAQLILLSHQHQRQHQLQHQLLLLHHVKQDILEELNLVNNVLLEHIKILLEMKNVHHVHMVKLVVRVLYIVKYVGLERNQN